MLQDIQVRKAQPGAKPYKLADERGLYLLVNPTGSKLWRFDYRHQGKRKTLSIGVYPDVSLADARTKRDDARQLLALGSEPGNQKKVKSPFSKESIYQEITYQIFEEIEPYLKKAISKALSL